VQEGFYVPQYPLAIIIPTYNRADVLAQCLAHLENQTRRDFEVVVVDDGSTDSTPDLLRSYALRTPLSFRYVRQENRGPARARNHAISLIEAPICLMIGDDIFASPTLVEKHLEVHLARPDDSVAALGLTLWSDTGQTVTPFMRWMDHDGLQFQYGHLLNGGTPDFRHFYTSNLSVKTRVVKLFPFDESFPHAAMEDIELACRIEARHGLELVFVHEAVGYHIHPTTFTQACRRMIRVGESAAHFEKMWPGKLSKPESSVKRALRRIVLCVPVTLPLWVRLADLSLKVACPNSLMNFVLECHFVTGYRRSRLPQRAKSTDHLSLDDVRH
jgi:glycosyltransferase involved in cell wall biosynthesis